MADKHPRIHGKALHRPGSAPLPHPSPATVEMAGLFVVPLEKDFKKVTFADLEKVWEEVSITEDEENELIRKIRDEA